MTPRSLAVRKSAAFAQAYGSKERCDFVANLPCRVCGALPSVNAHSRGGGVGRKGPYQSIVPLCDRHHQAMHRGQQSFAAQHGLNLEALAADVEARWVRHSGGERTLFDSTPTWMTEEDV